MSVRNLSKSREKPKKKIFFFILPRCSLSSSFCSKIAVEKAKKLYQQPIAPQPQQPNSLFIRVEGEWRNIAIDKITYVNGMKDYVMFYLDNEPKALITHLTMKAVEEMLPKDKFLRIHRSYIVHVDKIKKVDRNDCVYIGNEVIHIPEGYLPAFKSFLETHSF